MKLFVGWAGLGWAVADPRLWILWDLGAWCALPVVNDVRSQGQLGGLKSPSEIRSGLDQGGSRDEGAHMCVD